MTAAVGIDTVLPEVAYLSARQGDTAILNAVADFSSYFERDDVLRFGERVHELRIPDVGPIRSLDAACRVIGRAAYGFAVRTSDHPDLTTLYFVSDDGLIQLDLVGQRVLLTHHADPGTVATLVGRRLDAEPEQVLIVRHDSIAGTRYLAARSHGHAYSNDGSTWRHGASGGSRADAVTRFVTDGE